MDKPRCYERCILRSYLGRTTNKIMWLYHSLVNEPVYQTGYLGSNPSSHLNIFALVAKPGNAADCNSAMREFKS